jgi:hypothetical protein
LHEQHSVLAETELDAATGAGPQVIAVSGSGGVLDGGDETDRRSGRWISYADVRVNAEVTSAQVAERRLRVP